MRQLLTSLRTLCLLVAAIYFNRQLYYVLNYDVNYRTEDIIRCRLLPDYETYRRYTHLNEVEQVHKRMSDYTLLKQRMDESPLFSSWCFGKLPYESDFTRQYINGKEEQQTVHIHYSDRPYMEMFGMELIKGRIWDDTDGVEQNKVIVNESALRMLGVEDYREARLRFTERLWNFIGGDGVYNPPCEVVGVVKDFNIGHLSNPATPVAFIFMPASNVDNMYAAIVPGKRQEAIAYLTDLFHELNGAGEFEYRFVEDQLAELYREDRRTARIFSAFALVAILISCLGLFGLSLYDIEQRYREIALRKVHGAKTRDIFHVLLHKYYYVLGIAFVLASALSYYGIHRYMQDYAHHAPVSWWMFLLAGLITLLISFCTVGWQIRRAMQIHPAEAMKRE